MCQILSYCWEHVALRGLETPGTRFWVEATSRRGLWGLGENRPAFEFNF